MKVYKEGQSSKKEIELRLVESDDRIFLIAADKKGDEVAVLLSFDTCGVKAAKKSGNILSEKGYDFGNLTFDEKGHLVIHKEAIHKE